jgi:four helix bundle protein
MEGEMGSGMEDLRVLKAAEEIADRLWEAAGQWPELARDTVGKQLIRAADSIGANIAEAFGRFHYGEKLQFVYYARGSLFETKYWVNRAGQRGLLASDQAEAEGAALATLAVQLNAYARSLKQQRSGHRQSGSGQVGEQRESYNGGAPHDPPALIEEEHLAWLEDAPPRHNP